MILGVRKYDSQNDRQYNGLAVKLSKYNLVNSVIYLIIWLGLFGGPIKEK